MEVILPSIFPSQELSIIGMDKNSGSLLLIIIAIKTHQWLMLFCALTTALSTIRGTPG